MSSNPFRKRASAERTRTSQDDPTPRQEPQTLTTSPNRSRASSWEVVDVPPPSPALQKRSPPPRPPSRNRRSGIPPPEAIADPFNPTTESPVSSDFGGDDDGDDIFTQEPTELGRPGTTSFPSAGSDGGYSVAKSGRQSLDADAFKRLMLTGQSSLSTPPTPGAGLTPLVVAPDSSTDTSSTSRQSIFDPIPEAADGLPDETPRTSNELDEGEERRQSKERTPKPKPPPPRARNRSGGRSPASPPSSAADIPSLTPPRPPSLHSISSERSLPPPPPPLPPVGSTSPILNETVSPPSPATSIISKKIAPSPPLSRRHSVQSNTNPLRPSTPAGGANTSKMKPPPPPIRRHKSTNSRASTTPLSALSVPPPPPPPPPSRRSRSSTANSYESAEEPPTTPPAKSSPLATAPEIPMVQGTETDILIDLEKLQREVDELRGKYEGKGVGPAVST
ncbi:hypothetical protein B9Z19DRAFT_1004450 [Tuber borchii]|uniref:Uncharacterized protein n=1 Tax=Tuber borchii TaxID=42251 RepID=A0A2T6ZD70_TUBBO|nr:hypothetical protein B9Z19DRAFT_1004450 [Tuber borchii]